MELIQYNQTQKMQLDQQISINSKFVDTAQKQQQILDHQKILQSNNIQQA